MATDDHAAQSTELTKLAGGERKEQMTPMERELLKSVELLVKQSNASAKAIVLSTSKLANEPLEDRQDLSDCVILLAESQLRLVDWSIGRLVDWCRASASETSSDGSATMSLEKVQQDLSENLKALK